MNNKYIIATMLAAIMVLSIVAFVPAAMAVKPTSSDPAIDYNGNGAPSGPHYTLNIIGVPNEKQGGAWMNDYAEDLDYLGHDNGHRMFVQLNRDGSNTNTKIRLQQGDTFAVLDVDGTDGWASLQLPVPYDNLDSSEEAPTNPRYEIYVRNLGNPSGTGKLNTAMRNKSNLNEWFYSDNPVEFSERHGQVTFKRSTLELTTVHTDIGDGLLYYPIFGMNTYDYFWVYDNYNLKLLQIRFYWTEDLS